MSTDRISGVSSVTKEYELGIPKLEWGSKLGQTLPNSAMNSLLEGNWQTSTPMESNRTYSIGHRVHFFEEEI